MSLYHRILVALDGSADSEAALHHALALAHDQNALLTLLSVATPNPSTAATAGAAPPDPTELHAEIIREAVAEAPQDTGIETRLERGDPAETILAIAAKDRHDLIVMGSHGHSRVHRALLGSVSERVLKKAVVPVLLLRGRRPE